MDCGACLGCGLGITDNNEGIPWQSGKPNPLPIFKSADGFWTPLLLPGLYLPVGLIIPQKEESGLVYHPLSDRDLVDRLTAFIIHESVHQMLLLGIIPTTLRLSAANFYTGLVTLLKNDFDTDIWHVLNHLNHSIQVVHDATKAMHEAAAIVENQITTPFDNPYIQDFSEKSASSYAKDYGSEFIRYYQKFRLLITALKDQFSPTPFHRLTITALADYIISSAIDLQELANNILKVPAPIPSTALRDYMGAMGIPYLESGDLIGQRTLEHCPYIQISSGGFAIYGVAPRLDRTMSAILSAKFKRHRKMPENYIDQLLYIAELIPELKLWLQSIEARHWV